MKDINLSKARDAVLNENMTVCLFYSPQQKINIFDLYDIFRVAQWLKSWQCCRTE